jgi:hypothetical protein
VLEARSTSECHLYMDLHPCERCGEADFPWSRHGTAERSGGLVSEYEGICPTCGTPRRFEFRVPHDPVPPPAFGGPEPSRIIDPGEFYEMGERAAAYAVAPADATPERRGQAREAAADALAAAEEVLKFLPPHADAVPEDAFTSDDGRSVYKADPAAFDRRRLESLVRARRQALLALRRAVVAADRDPIR